MRAIGAVSAYLTVEVTAADVAETLRELTNLEMMIYELRPVSELTVRLKIGRTDLPLLDRYTQRKGVTFRILGREGLYWGLQKLRKRWLLIVGLVLLLAAAWIVPGRICIIEVQGNDTVPQKLILEAAQRSGIRFGASRREVRSEKIKNALLHEIPELQWAGVNTYGSRAVITVRERSTQPEPESLAQVSSIVAARDGIILSATATRGNPLVTPGQAVKAGQVLISGYTDCGLSIEATRAQGDVFARTGRDLTAVTPAIRQLREEEGEKTVKYSLIIGKMRINFFKGSGISGATCVKMYSKYVLTLPGGFALPVALICQTQIEYRTREEALPEESAKSCLEDFSRRYLQSSMIAGTVVDSRVVWEKSEVYTLRGYYECEEMIGRVKEEEIGVYHGKTD